MQMSVCQRNSCCLHARATVRTQLLLTLDANDFVTLSRSCRIPAVMKASAFGCQSFEWPIALLGMRLRYAEWGDGEDTLLLQHDVAEAAAVWAPVAQRLAERGFRVVAYDLRGMFHCFPCCTERNPMRWRVICT